MILETTLAASAIMLASLSGVFFIQKNLRNWLEQNLPYLISFSAGVFLITAGFLALEAEHLLDNWYTTSALVLSGFALSALLGYLLPETHHHHDECCDEHKPHGNAGKRILIGDGIHNIADGLVLVPAFLVSPMVGFGTAFAIFVHEFLQEISEFTVLRQSGYSVNRALLTNFLVSGTILVGVGIGFVVADTELIQAMLLAVSAGFFIHVVSRDLLPHHHDIEHGQEFLYHLLLVGVGLVVMFGVTSLFAHEHEHDTHEHSVETSHTEEHDDEHNHEEDHDHE